MNRNYDYNRCAVSYEIYEYDNVVLASGSVNIGMNSYPLVLDEPVKSFEEADRIIQLQAKGYIDNAIHTGEFCPIT